MGNSRLVASFCVIRLAISHQPVLPTIECHPIVECEAQVLSTTQNAVRIIVIEYQQLPSENVLFIALCLDAAPSSRMDWQLPVLPQAITVNWMQ